MLLKPKFSHLPDALHLQKVTWQLFGTCTMRLQSTSSQILRKTIATIRHVSRRYSRKVAKQILLFCKFEGCPELLHAHFLMAGIPEHLDSKQFGADFARYWARHAGNCHVVPYDPVLDGIGYVTKCDYDADLPDPYYSPALIKHLTSGDIAPVGKVFSQTSRCR